MAPSSPQVAVTEIDRAIEDEGRIWRVAAAVAFPANKGAAAAAADWRRILAELRGQGRAFPPVPALGDEMLLAELKRFTALLPRENKAVTVAKRLEGLCKIYRTMRGRDIGQEEADLIVPAVEKLEQAAEAALSADGA